MPPELPEVETIKKQLESKLPYEIESVEYSAVADSLFGKKEFELEAKLVIDKISRKGKLLQFHLSGKLSLFSHLGMSGGWRLSSQKILEKHTHLQLAVNTPSGRFFLGYVDPRRFGQFDCLREKSSKEKLLKLGPDLTSSDFSAEYLHHIFKTFPDKVLKPFLLDQKYFAGLGNYMASEICALAGIRPMRKCRKISKDECHKIKSATDALILGQLARSGLTFSGGYSDTTGSKGEGLSSLVVFHQKICGLCKVTSVKKITMNTRGTFYCPKCQK